MKHCILDIEREDESPAFTVRYSPGSSKPPIDVDLVPSLEIFGWPKYVTRIKPKWTSYEVGLDQKCMEKYFLVTKPCIQGTF